MTTTKPAIVIVPGAWHVPHHYRLLTTRLEDAGYEVHAVDLPSMKDATKADAWKEDVKLVSRTAEQLADQGRDVIIVVHSRGGLVGGDAAEGLSAEDRAKEGKEGGVVRMVYLAAFAVAEGVWFDDPPVKGAPNFLEFDGELCRPKNIHDNFYGDLSADVVKEQSKYLRDMHVSFINHTPKYAAWRHIPSTYLVCENDKAIPVHIQEAMIARLGAKFTTVERCASAHSPFLSMPDFTAEVVRRAAGEKI